MKFSYEYTDTFGGSPNYSWVKRGEVDAKDLPQAFRAVKKALGLSGVRGVSSSYGERIEFRPFRSCTVLFINPAE